MNSKVIRRALVTGSTRGIGLAIVENLLDQGFEVLSTGTQKSPKVPKGSEYHQVDFTDKDSLNKFLSYLDTTNFDILINNAGINEIDKFTEIPEDHFNRILEVNLIAPFETDLTNRILGKTGIEEVQKTIPIGRLGSVKEIASFISWLASDENTYISGQNLVIDGGFTRV